MPTAWPSFTSTIAFDFTCPQMRHASSASRHSDSVGARLVTTRQSSRAATKWWGVLHEEPARDLAEVEVGRFGRRRLEEPRVLPLLAQRVDRALARSPGAITTSACGPATIRSTVAASIGRLSATIPPNAERSSHSSARWYAVGEVVGDRDAARVRVLDDGARRA